MNAFHRFAIFPLFFAASLLLVKDASYLFSTSKSNVQSEWLKKEAEEYGDQEEDKDEKEEKQEKQEKDADRQDRPVHMTPTPNAFYSSASSCCFPFINFPQSNFDAGAETPPPEF